MARDMSKAQFDAAIKRHGFTPEGFMGYYELGVEGQRAMVSVLNAGQNRRARLAYLLRKREELEAEMEKKRATK